MGFLKKFFRNVFRDQAPVTSTSSFERLSEEELEAHLAVERYGSFTLTCNAVRPSYDLQVVPSQGFRHDVYRDEESKTSVPVLMGAASREDLFEVFMDLLDPLGPEVDVVLETSHNRENRGPGPVSRAHRFARAQKHFIRLRRFAGQRRLHGHRGLEPACSARSAVRRT